jgi:hypothetical protein
MSLRGIAATLDAFNRLSSNGPCCGKPLHSIIVGISLLLKP